MASWDRARAAGRRALLMFGWVLVGTVAVVLAMLAPDLYRFLPLRLRRHPIGLALGTLSAVYALGRIGVRRAAGRPGMIRTRRGLDQLDGLSEFGLAGGLSAVVLTACAGLLAAWLPHFLLWPWCRDADTFATIAQSWDAGILPYRDIRGYNFPGAIYLFWILGQVFGWGRTWSLYAFDASALILLGIALSAWSRQCAGRLWPGGLAYLVFLTFYLNLDYEAVAERDWHACLCVVLGLLVLQAWPGRRSRILSAALAAAAMAIRPHIVVFLPALGMAVVERTSRAGTGPHGDGAGKEPRRRRALIEWGLAFGAFTAMAWAPLLIAGIADDLVRGLSVVAPGGPYNRSDSATAWRALGAELQEPGTLVVFGLLLVVLGSGPGPWRRRAATWTVALIGAIAYRLFHPVQHFYLIHPVGLLRSTAVAVPMAWIGDRCRFPAFLRVMGLAGVTYVVSPGFPLFCNVPAALAAVDGLVRGQTFPTSPPPGSFKWFGPSRPPWYSWDDYRRVLIHLGETTGPTTLVANVLKEPPFPSLNGPAARLSPFRAESGICWMWLVALDLDAEFAEQLEQAANSVVVWCPAEQEMSSRLKLERLTAVIRKHYRFETRYGRIEVWRRAGSPRTADGSSRTDQRVPAGATLDPSTRGTGIRPVPRGAKCRWPGPGPDEPPWGEVTAAAPR